MHVEKAAMRNIDYWQLLIAHKCLMGGRKAGFMNNVFGVHHNLAGPAEASNIKNVDGVGVKVPGAN